MKPWKTILMYLFNFLIGVCLYYSYYFIFEKVYTYKVEFFYTKQPPGLPKLPELSGYWRPILTYDIKGINGCDYLPQMQKNEYDLKVISCERFAKKGEL